MGIKTIIIFRNYLTKNLVILFILSFMGGNYVRSRMIKIKHH